MKKLLLLSCVCFSVCAMDEASLKDNVKVPEMKRSKISRIPLCSEAEFIFLVNIHKNGTDEQKAIVHEQFFLTIAARRKNMRENYINGLGWVRAPRLVVDKN